MNRILVVDDEINMQVVLRAMLKKEGYEVFTAPDGREALKVLADDDIDVVVTDLKMPNLDGMGLLERVAADYPAVPVIMITAHGTVATAVDALKKGAFDYVTKPFEQDELKNVVLKAIKTRRLSDEEFVAGADEIDRYGIVGASEPMQEIFETIKRVAPTTTTILISGETGTGKELIANAIHINSPRKGNPLIKINCAAIAENLMESELFGYEKGAFTGAVVTKPGRFELAHKGTLFLDEVGELPKEMQVKLLRVIQEQTFERVGGLKTIKVDVRLITATNRNLFQDVKEGRFREDLFYRLNVLPIHLPALRERRDDIPTLIAYFVDRFRKKLGRDIQGLEDDVLDLFINYDWPGNIREMENLLERLVLMARGQTIAMADVPGEIKQAVYEQSLLPPEKKPSQF
ncbi:MAG TPA: sigma-54 dependent transcriptional regulator, partial [Syntrophales bacterium]|nr:sigma-54 dependent transcriptional regulator [Syntrophales bacterium]